MPNKPTFGTKSEVKTFHEVNSHYDLAKQDLESRFSDWDRKDELFLSHIDEASWPYNAQVFDPRTFTAVFEKTARLLANKPRGRLVPREGGDSLGAKINNEILSFQWDDSARVDGVPMLAKLAMMDQNARRYGASFGLCKWRNETRINPTTKKREVVYDGPEFRPLVNRDCLPNPSYSFVKNWFQHRDYVTIQELQTVNDVARGKPVYKNLDLLKRSLREEAKSGGDRRDTNYFAKTKTIRGLDDFLGRDEVFKVVEIVTEYREDKWITFSPRHGIVIRDIPNPYSHGQIPIIMLKYYPVDDDIYGLSELDPTEKLQKATNAVLCQYLDAINMGLYPVLKVRTTGVQMNTLEFGPGNKWLMNNPADDVLPYDTGTTGIAEFGNTYNVLVSSMQEAWGETSQGISNLAPGETDKTATEIRDLALQRSARDNYNQLFLAEALKRQMGLWQSMNKQFYFGSPEEQVKVIRIVGKDAIRFFEQQGLSEMGLTPRGEELLTAPELEDVPINAFEIMQPISGVEVEGESLPKFTVEEAGDVGHLIVERDDMSGNYDYIPDIESMSLPNDQQLIAAKSQMVQLAQEPVFQQSLAAEGYRMKTKELIEDFFEQLGLKDADKYFEKIGGLDEEAAQQGQAQQPGAGGAQPGQQGMGAGGVGGMAGSAQTPPGGQNKPQLARSA